MDETSTLLRPLVEEAEALAFEHGRIVGNRYEIKRRLGRGGMGEVWLAFDLRLRVDVALKVLLSHGERATLLHQEIRAAREVISPNVCRVFDLVEADGLELLSMEFVDGITLRQHLAENSPLEFFQAQEIAAQFLAGLEAIHAAGLVHSLGRTHLKRGRHSEPRRETESCCDFAMEPHALSRLRLFASTRSSARMTSGGRGLLSSCDRRNRRAPGYGI